MRGYISLKSYNKDGNLGINLKVFETIAYQTLNDIKGIKKRNQSDEKIKPSVQASIKNNKVSFKFNLLLEKDVSKEIVKDEVSKVLNYNLLNYLEAVPYGISFTFLKEESKK